PAPPPPRSTLFPYTTLFRSQSTSWPSALSPSPQPFAHNRRTIAVAGGVCRRARIHRRRFANPPITTQSASAGQLLGPVRLAATPDRKSTRLNSSHEWSSYAV